MNSAQSDADYKSGVWDKLHKPHELGHYGVAAALATRQQVVLEIGCGEGNVAALIPQHVRYTGIDVSGVAINRAKERLPRFSFVATDFSTWEPDALWPCILFGNSLQYLGDPDAAVARAARWLTRDGCMIVSQYARRISFSGWRVVEEFEISTRGEFWTVTMFKKEGL